MGALLVVVGGFLLGGTVSLWRQARQGSGDARRNRQLHVAALVLAVLAAGSLAAGLPQVM